MSGPSEIEQRIAEETARKMHPLNLRRAHDLVVHARNDLRMAKHMMNPETDPILRDLAENIADNDLDQLAWAIESVVRLESK